MASGPGRDRVDADALRPELGGEVADGGLERGLGDAHDVVVLHHLLGAVIGHGEERAAVLHQRLGEMRHADEGPDRDVHRHLEALRAATSMTRPPRASLVEKAIEWTRKSSLPQSCGDAVEDRLELAVGHHVHRHEDRRLDLAGQRLDVRLRLVVEVGDRELGAEGAEGAGAAPGDRAVVGDADDQALACRRAASRSRAGRVMSAPPDQGEGVARDHQLLVRRDDEKRDAAVGSRDAGGAGLVGGRVELGAEPAQALGDAGADRGRVLADAGGEDEARRARRARRRAGRRAARSGGRSGRSRRPRAGSSLASRSRMSFEMPERPLRPDAVVEEVA